MISYPKNKYERVWNQAYIHSFVLQQAFFFFWVFWKSHEYRKWCYKIMGQMLINARVYSRNLFCKLELNNVNDLLLQCYYFLIIFYFFVVMRQKEINCFEVFSKKQIKWSKILLGFSLRLAFSSYSSLRAASDDMNLRKTYCFRS